MIKNKVKDRKQGGVSLIELCAGFLIAVPIFLLAFDGLMLAVGRQINDRTCLDAARLAASGDPSLAESRVQNIITQANEEKNGTIVQLRLVSVINSVNPADLKFAQLNGGTITGTVTVTTAADLKPFFASWVSQNKLITFESKQCFPYTYVLKPPPEPKDVSTYYFDAQNKK